MTTSTAVYWALATSVDPTRFRTIDPDERSSTAPAEPAPRATRTPTDKVTVSADAKALGGKKLSPEEQQVVEKLKARDAEVHAHEAAHMASAGAAGGGASYTYQLGPDGRLYAVGGEVPVSLRAGSTPDETIANAERVQRAALAPASPSSQDLAVAGMAARMIADARAQKAREASKAYEKVKERLTGDDGAAEGQPALPTWPPADAAVEPGLAA